MAGESEDGFGFAAIRLIINLGALGVSAGLVALVVAAIVAELD
jgi:hypothetical protein